MGGTMRRALLLLISLILIFALSTCGSGGGGGGGGGSTDDGGGTSDGGGGGSDGDGGGSVDDGSSGDAGASDVSGDFLLFKFEAVHNPALSSDLEATINGSDIYILLPVGVDVSPDIQVATFSTSDDVSSVTLDGVTQTSGVTNNRYAYQQTYQVERTDETTGDYTLRIDWVLSNRYTAGTVTFNDNDFEAAARDELIDAGILSSPTDEIKKSDAMALTDSFSSNDPNVTDITEIKEFESITRLYLDGTTVVDFTPLQTMDNLQYLHLGYDYTAYRTMYNNNSSYDFDVTPIGQLTGLVDLLIKNCDIPDPSPLANLINLGSLKIWNCDIDEDGGGDWSFLESLDLDMLSLTDSNISSSEIEHFDHMTDMTKLYMRNFLSDGDVNITSLSGIENLTSLDVVRINGNIDDFTPLRDITTITDLQLNNCDMDVTEFSNLFTNFQSTNLTTIYIGNYIQWYHMDDPSRGQARPDNLNIITDINPLSGKINSLQFFYADNMSSTGVSGISILDNLPSLRWIDLMNNNLNHHNVGGGWGEHGGSKALTSLPELTYLNLDDNPQLYDITAFDIATSPSDSWQTWMLSIRQSIGYGGQMQLYQTDGQLLSFAPSRLRELYLEGNEVDGVSPNFAPPDLAELDLSNNKLWEDYEVDFSGLPDMIDILDLSGNCNIFGEYGAWLNIELGKNQTACGGDNCVRTIAHLVMEDCSEVQYIYFAADYDFEWYPTFTTDFDYEGGLEVQNLYLANNGFPVGSTWDGEGDSNINGNDDWDFLDVQTAFDPETASFYYMDIYYEDTFDCIYYGDCPD